jgi:hypothetical protein
MNNTHETYRYDVLNSLIEKNGFKSYLEIGYQQAICFNAVKCERKDAVDPAPMHNDFMNTFQGKEFYLGTSDDFFAFTENKYDLIFIDGLHTYEQVKRDFENAIKCLNPGGLIMLHDMNPSSEERAKSFAEGGQWNGDCYKVAIDLFRGEYKFKYYTVDDDNGCLVVNPFEEDEDRPLREDHQYTYAYLDSNRQDILNLCKL